MTGRVGLLTGSGPFAGLPDNPAELLLPEFEGRTFGDVTIRTISTPARLVDLPNILPTRIAAARPAFVLSLGLSVGSPVLKLETTAINRLSFGVADNDGQRPIDGRPIDPQGPPARFATWPAAEILEAVLAADLPAILSHFAGTHLCNGVLYTVLGAMEAEDLPGPAGFLHLPYLPVQVARFQREAPATGDHAPVRPRDLPSMAFADQARAVSIALARLAAMPSP